MANWWGEPCSWSPVDDDFQGCIVIGRADVIRPAANDMESGPAKAARGLHLRTPAGSDIVVWWDNSTQAFKRAPMVLQEKLFP